MKKKDTRHPGTTTYALIILTRDYLNLTPKERWDQYFRNKQKADRADRRLIQQQLQKQLYGE